MHIIRILCTLVLLILATSTLWADQIEVVAGAGPSTQITKLFFKQFPKHKDTGHYRFIVVEKSAKHLGGVVNADNFLFGRTGRLLFDVEKSFGKREIILAQIPISFAGGSGVPRIPFSMSDIQKIYTREIDNWKAFGGSDVPIELIGRERLEAVFISLKEQYPFFKTVIFDRVFHHDDIVAQFLTSPSGKYALAFGAAPNFPALNRVSVTDLNLGIEVGLVYDIVNEAHPIILAAKEFAASVEWQRFVRDAGMTPVD